MDPTDRTGPTDRTDPTDPTNPTYPIHPTDPTDLTDPTDMTDLIDLADLNNLTDPTDPSQGCTQCNGLSVIYTGCWLHLVHTCVMGLYALSVICSLCTSSKKHSLYCTPGVKTQWIAPECGVCSYRNCISPIIPNVIQNDDDCNTLVLKYIPLYYTNTIVSM
jgi:hypothetical protein